MFGTDSTVGAMTEQLTTAVRIAGYILPADNCSGSV